MAGISKAEYLKRYMSGTDKDEKKKKKKKIGKTVSKHARFESLFCLLVVLMADT